MSVLSQSSDFAIPEDISESDLDASLCRDSFEHFVKQFWLATPGAMPLKWGWHMSYLCDLLQGIAERVFQGLPRLSDECINISPGTSKSTICSILFPVWIWTRMSKCRIMTASHTDDLVIDLAAKSRSVIRSDKFKRYFPEIVLSGDTNAKSHYRNVDGGERMTCTVAGRSPMGQHAQILIIDDPIDPKKVLSEPERRSAAEFVTHILPSRKIPDSNVSVTLLIMQRLGIGDPTEVLLEVGRRPGAAPVRHTCLPAELTDDVSPVELREKYVDGYMDPLRLTADLLRERRANLGEYAYAGQYLQRPVPLGGGMFKSTYFNLRVKSSPFNVKRRIFYIDRACLVAGTMVETFAGPEPIEDIKPGQLVLTRDGYKEVEWSGLSKIVTELIKVEFDNGSVIWGTPDHKVWTTNRGWVELYSLCMLDNCLDKHGNRFILPVRITGTGAPRSCLFPYLPGKGTPVYDLTVRDSHEFFANGILVHNSTANGGCATAGVLMSWGHDGDFYIEDVMHGHWEPTERNQITLAYAQKYRLRYGRHEPEIWVEREGGSSGRDAWKGVVRTLAGFNVREHDVSRLGSKDVRAEPWSCQLAAGNVKLVDDSDPYSGRPCSWDINGYVTEHSQFRPLPGTKKRLGGLVDRIDASAGAFSIFVRSPQTIGLRCYTLGKTRREKSLRLVACSVSDLDTVEIIDHPCVLVTLRDPQLENIEDSWGADCCLNSLPQEGGMLAGIYETGQGDLPPIRLTKLIGCLNLRCADLNPEDYQDRWDTPLDVYNGLTPDKVVTTREDGKALWSFLTRKRDVPWEVCVLADRSGGRLALSVALGIVDALRLPRYAVFCPNREGDEVNDDEKPSNPHVHNIVKSSKALVAC